MLLDLPARRFYFFFIELWPQEVYYFTGLLILAAMTLFLMNAVAGRLWCGYLCPQTVWTDLFYAVERWVEGDRRERIFRDAADRRRFVETLGEVCAKTGWQVHDSVLMPNHFHLVGETPQPNLVAGM